MYICLCHLLYYAFMSSQQLHLAKSRSLRPQQGQNSLTKHEKSFFTLLDSAECFLTDIQFLSRLLDQEENFVTKHKLP